MGKIINPIRDQLVLQIRNEFTFFLFRILFPITVIILIIYAIIYFGDPDDSLSYSSFPTVFLLGIASLISVRVLFYTRLEGYEVKKIIAVSLFLLFNFIAEIFYFYEQFFLRISVPYPSIADIGYLSSNIFLAYHLFSSLISLKKERNLKMSYILIVSIGVSIIPIYLSANGIYNLGIDIDIYTTLFLTDLLYYVLDILLLAPSIIIILNINRNDPLLFHWLSMALGISFLVFGDFGYTYSGQVSEELLEKTLPLWKIFYAISYLLLASGIFWYGKIKKILFDEKVNIILKNALIVYKSVSKYESYHEDNDHKIEIEINREYEDSNEIFKTMTELLQKTERDINILFTNKSFLTINKLDRLFVFVRQLANHKHNLKIRILAPISENRDRSINQVLSITNEQILVLDFKRHLNFDAIIFLLDNKFLLIIELESISNHDKSFSKAIYTNNQSKVLIWTNFFDRLWLSEIANRIS